MIENNVKLVIWDLDDTFWGGTLLEGGIAPIASNVELVKALSCRGIINSICSKNDHDKAKATLSELGIWEHFVFPHIAFSPKGQAIARMLETAGLRAENTLFIDDNPSNLEEAKFFNPGIMVAHPKDVLEALLEHPNCAGKHDPKMTRLKQYQFLQRKAEERTTSSLSNEEFLRTSNIRVTIDREHVEDNFDRIVELINRTNQLNYTKRRLKTSGKIEQFREQLRKFGYQAGCVHVVDNYGDYGLAGFFLMKRRPNDTRLIHFVFSCRTMNMGVEQWVYEQIGRPDIDIEGPVSYGLDTHTSIDWINAAAARDADGAIAKDWKLVLLGGCDLLQLASHCSTNRLEFVNRMRGEIKARYDDPGFILTDRAVLKEHADLLPIWTYEDALQFDNGIASSRLILLCMGAAMNGQYYRIRNAVTVRMAGSTADELREADKEIFDENFEKVELDQEERLKLLLDSYELVGAHSSQDAQIFIIGTYTKGLSEIHAGRRTNINGAYEAFCRNRPKFRYLDMDALLPSEQLVSNRHFSPLGYHMLARHILAIASRSGEAEADASLLAVAAA